MTTMTLNTVPENLERRLNLDEVI